MKIERGKSERKAKERRERAFSFFMVQITKKEGEVVQPDGPKNSHSVLKCHVTFDYN